MVQLAKTVKDVTIFGVCSKSKHEALKAAGTIDYLLERGTDYSNEVRKYVNGSAHDRVARSLFSFFSFGSCFTQRIINLIPPRKSLYMFDICV